MKKATCTVVCISLFMAYLYSVLSRLLRLQATNCDMYLISITYIKGMIPSIIIIL